MKHIVKNTVFPGTLALAVLALTACDGDNNPTAADLSFQTSLDAVSGEFPEDIELSADGTVAYASFFPANRVGRFNSGDLSPRASVAVIAPTGITRANDGSGDMLVATAPWFQGAITGADNSAVEHTQGVWRVSADGQTTQVAQLDIAGVLPNGIAVDDGNNIYVSNLIGDQVYKIDSFGNVTTWLQNPLLSGNGSADAATPSPGFSLGINGLRYQGNRLYLSNTDSGQVLEVEILADGNPGPVGIYMAAPALVGIDGFDMDESGNVYAANLLNDTIVFATPGGHIEILADANNGLAGPTGVSLVTSGKLTRLFYNNFSIPVFPFLSAEAVNKPTVGSFPF